MYYSKSWGVIALESIGKVLAALEFRVLGSMGFKASGLAQIAPSSYMLMFKAAVPRAYSDLSGNGTPVRTLRLYWL